MRFLVAGARRWRSADGGRETLGAEKLFVNEPTITIAEKSVAGNDGSAGNGDVAPPGDGDGGNPAAVASCAGNFAIMCAAK